MNTSNYFFNLFKKYGKQKFEEQMIKNAFTHKLVSSIYFIQKEQLNKQRKNPFTYQFPSTDINPHQNNPMITQIPQIHENLDISSMLKNQLQSSRYGHKISSINMSLIQHLQGDMLQDKLAVADEEKPFRLKSVDDNTNKADKTEMEISQLLCKRQSIQNELKKLQHQEYKLHISQSRYGLAQSKLSQSMVSSSSPQRNFRSQLTEEEKAKIKSVLKAQKKFIKQLKLKEIQYYQEVQKDRLQKIEAQENIKKQKCQQRKAYWQRIRNDIAQRQQSRKKKFVEDQNRLQEVKKSKKLYEVLEDSWNHQLAQDQRLIKQATQHMRQDHKFDIGKIVEHEKEYQRLAKQKQQARQRSVDQFNDRMKLTLPKIPSSKFFTTLKEEQKRKKEEEQERERKRLELNQKMYEFSKRVKEDYKPKIDQTAKKLLQISIQQQKIQKKQGLPLGEVYNLGNHYMRQAHRNAALIKAARETVQKADQSSQKAQKTVKKNYLTQLKQKRKTQYSNLSLTNEVTKIMKNTTYSAVEKIQRAKLVAKRLEGKENLKSTALISSINQKMKILKALNEEA